MIELINELNIELYKFFEVIPGYSGQKERILSLIKAIEKVAENHLKEE